ncbi:MAG: dihydropteroate synthase [Crocinitomicaceae bacterium]
MKDTFFCSNFQLNFRGNLKTYERPIVMGILNITEDSFYAESRLNEANEIVEKASKMLHEGAGILDIGAYSSRPGAKDVPVEIEKVNAVKAIRAILELHPEAILSVDTFRSEVAAAAIDAGALMINDISGGIQDPAIFNLAAEKTVPLVLMHMKGTPQNMQNNCNYENLIKEVIYFLQQQINAARKAGVNDIIVDPGFGFSKDLDQNYTLLKELERFSLLEAPLLAGLSRKSMIYKKLGSSPGEALNGTSVLNTVALNKGAAILRVHDVKAANEAITLTEAIHCAE